MRGRGCTGRGELQDLDVPGDGGCLFEGAFWGLASFWPERKLTYGVAFSRGEAKNMPKDLAEVQSAPVGIGTAEEKFRPIRRKGENDLFSSNDKFETKRKHCLGHFVPIFLNPTQD